MKKTKDTQLYKMLFTIALPIAMQNMLAFLTQMVDTIMLGELGDVPLSASALANQVFFIYTLFIFGMSGGAAVLTAQYWGKNQIVPIKIVMATVLRITASVGLVLSILVLIFPSFVMQIFTSDPQIIEAGVQYLRIIGYVYFIFGISNIIVSLLRSIEMVKLAVFSNTISLIVNCFLNWVLIFGNLGAPRLEIIGAAYATLIAKIIELIFVLLYVFVYDKKLNLKFKDLLLRDKALSQDLLRYCSPVVINEVIWSIGISLQSVVFGRINPLAVSAASITNVIQQLSTTFIFGVAAAAAVIIGKTIGEGNISLALARGNKLKVFSVFLGFFACGIILLLKKPFIEFYNVSEETKVLASQMMNTMAVIVVFIAISGVAIVGILRGGGDTKFTLMIDILSLWIIALPVGVLAGLVFKAPVIVIYICFRSDEIAKSVLCILRMRGTKWIRNVTRDEIDFSSGSDEKDDPVKISE